MIEYKTKTMLLPGSSSSSSSSPAAPIIIVVGLNGALQKRFILPNQQILIPGNVHRAQSISVGVGGKGQDVAIALNCLGLRKSIKLMQFIGSGVVGDLVYQLLVNELGESAVNTDLTVRSSSEMRTCTTIVASNDESTELVEPSGIITNEEVEELVTSKLSNYISDYNNAKVTINSITNIKSLCIMGSMPPGVDDDTYAKIYSKVVTSGIYSSLTLCVIDSLAGINPLLSTASELMMANVNTNINTVGPILIKINASELCQLAGTTTSNETTGITTTELLNAINKFILKYVISSTDSDNKYTPLPPLIGVAITDGKHAAYFVSFSFDDRYQQEFKVHKFSVPSVNIDTIGTNTSTLFPIGAGDAVAAGLVGAWTRLEAEAVTRQEVLLSFRSVGISENCLELLLTFLENAESGLRLDGRTYRAITAFAFGLACGSASCLQEENSVLDEKDVIQLFQTMSMPDLLHSGPFPTQSN